MRAAGYAVRGRACSTPNWEQHSTRSAPQELEAGGQDLAQLRARVLRAALHKALQRLQWSKNGQASAAMSILTVTSQAPARSTAQQLQGSAELQHATSDPKPSLPPAPPAGSTRAAPRRPRPRRAGSGWPAAQRAPGACQSGSPQTCCRRKCVQKVVSSAQQPDASGKHSRCASGKEGTGPRLEVQHCPVAACSPLLTPPPSAPDAAHRLDICAGSVGLQALALQPREH